MKAMILAAGRGERMRPLTDDCPKPLLQVNGIPLIEYHIKNLVAAGIENIVINHAWLGQKIVDYLGCGKQFSANISYSEELIALETAGGIIKALPMLTEHEDDVFMVINADIYSDFDFKQLPSLSAECSAHLLLVENPEHNRQGDFVLVEGMLANPKSKQEVTYTFSGMALYRKSFFEQDSATRYQALMAQPAVQPLAPMLRAGADQQKISASVIDTTWTDVGTPERLARLNTI
ncbi:N-acetylmuramate alpha-1-phosphate uridylyltransferase MurU [Colwellia sp. C1TZA3]|uniref:N-acetylmuramate alpha-1-phosphate uridylyltransferase MurU n=1 Tax=Colwellia sp. C1TZA3 TaxID=2508879 RepID=UPI0011BA4125|nr:nucleotidyltransferase family protein [Colwellia sp. C1TZA3]TWX73178.1 nucleotidyltransferase family protein [Colwellia sp. C1TZA3]